MSHWHWVLVGTSLLFLVPLLFADYGDDTYLRILAALITVTSIVSVTFWSNPIQWGLAHRIDGVVAKTTFAVFLSYILFVKSMDAYLTSIFGISLVLLVLMIASSDIYSRREWCGVEHVGCHALFHVFSALCCGIAFM
jgi:hypothetical protein